MKPIYVITFLVFALSACRSDTSEVAAADISVAKLSEKGYDAAKRKVSSSDKYDDAPATSNPIVDTSKKLIKEGDISFEASDLKATRAKILASLSKLNGYLAQEQERGNSDDHQKTFILSLRVPSKNFDALLESISGDADRIDSKSISVKDVTSQYMDIQTSLNNQKLLENRYRELLKKTDKMSDVLQIESKLTDIRTTIDSTQGALNYLSKQVAYSSLEATFYTKQTEPYEGDTIGYKFKSALKNGWAILQNLFFGIITLWPVILFIVIFYVLIKRWRKRRRLKREQK